MPLLYTCGDCGEDATSASVAEKECALCVESLGRELLCMQNSPLGREQIVQLGQFGQIMPQRRAIAKEPP